MKHPRQAIREAVAERLGALAPVSLNRTDPLQRGELPCLAVYSRHEPVEEVTLARRQQRTLELVVDGYVAVPSGGTPDDALDALALRIEQTMAAGKRLGGLVDKIALASTTLDAVSDGAIKAGVVRMTFAVTYTTAFGATGA
jgi:hypothetical protein